jgi:hypothetical protein
VLSLLQAQLASKVHTESDSCPAKPLQTQFDPFKAEQQLHLGRVLESWPIPGPLTEGLLRVDRQGENSCWELSNRAGPFRRQNVGYGKAR